MASLNRPCLIKSDFYSSKYEGLREITQQFARSEHEIAALKSSKSEEETIMKRCS